MIGCTFVTIIDSSGIALTFEPVRTGWGNHTAIIGYGERWRFQRKVMHEVLQKGANEERWPLIERDSRHALQRIMANPGNVIGGYKATINNPNVSEEAKVITSSYPLFLPILTLIL